MMNEIGNWCALIIGIEFTIAVTVVLLFGAYTFWKKRKSLFKEPIQ